MKVEADPEVAAWLAEEVREFDWDRGNKRKSERKHRVPDATIQAVLSNEYFFMGRIVEREHSEPRYLALGTAGQGGRGFALVFTIRSDRVRPISCRPMRNNERRIYEEALKEE